MTLARRRLPRRAARRVAGPARPDPAGSCCDRGLYRPVAPPP